MIVGIEALGIGCSSLRLCMSVQKVCIDGSVATSLSTREEGRIEDVEDEEAEERRKKVEAN
jgi:hypothetical protein